MKKAVSSLRCVSIAVAWVVASCLSGCSSPPSDVVQTTGIQSGLLSGCAVKAVTVSVQGMAPQLLKTCADGSGTIFAVTATIHERDVISIAAEPYPATSASPMPTGASGLVTDNDAIVSVAGTSVTALHPGTVTVLGYGPLYCDEVTNVGSIPMPTPGSTNSPTDAPSYTCGLIKLSIGP